MRVVIPFHQGDVIQARALLKWIVELGPCSNRKALLVADAGMQWSSALDVLALANKAFQSADLICTDKPYSGWPEAANWMFYYAARHIADHIKEPFLWLEPDAIPIKRGWLESICGQYQGGVLGHIYKFERPGSPFAPIDVMSGVAVYPPDAFSLICGCIKIKPEVAWDVSACGPMVKNGWHTDLIHHFFGTKDSPPTFALNKTAQSAHNTMTLQDIKPGAVLFHRNKDGTLISLARDKFVNGWRPSQSKRADIVSLRRAGDIIALFPLVKRMSEKMGRPIRMVVHRDFLPIFEGVSYTTPVRWDGDWEDPLQAVRMHGGTNAQVFGRGLNPNTQTENFAKLAWKKLGYQWNRYLPLRFDQRDFDREEALAAQVIKTDKPIILVKQHGLSSPFPDHGMVWELLRTHFGQSCELVNMDELRAERIYDMCGLMDRAACMITTDTATLWLARASRCPVIAFVNGTGFAASPAQGNTLLRLPYHTVKTSWPKIDAALRTTISARPTNNDIVLGYSHFIPKDEDTHRRNDAAMKTWPHLGARFAPLHHTRASKLDPESNGPPFVRDLIYGTMNSGIEDIIAIVNNDIKLDPNTAEAVRKSCEQWGCFWCYRTDRPGGATDQGADFFAFTRAWWNMHQHFFPDFVLGFWWWDDVMVRIMRWSGCMEQPRLCYHEPHRGVLDRLRTPQADHNEALAQRWLKIHDELREKP